MRRFSVLRTRPVQPTATTALRRRLDDLADTVVRELERGSLAAAWARVRALEQEADPTAPAAAPEPVPPAPVIGRRFAAAHRRMLFDPPNLGAELTVRTHPAA